MRRHLLVLFLLLCFPIGAAAQSTDWDKAYLDGMAAQGQVTLVDVAGLDPLEVYPLLLMPDSIEVIGDLDEVGRKVIDFRYRHPAVRSGEHIRLVNNGYVFQRTISNGPLKDSVVIVLGASGRTTVNVSRAFPDDALLRDAVTGGTTFVSFGLAAFDVHSSGILLIEEIQ